MIEIKHISQALFEVAEITQPIRVDRIDHQFMFQFEHGPNIELVFDSTDQCLTLMANLGEPGEAYKQSIYELLLEFSFLHHRTGGLSMCVDCATGYVWQSLRCPVNPLSIQSICKTLDRFRVQAGRWETLIAESCDPDRSRCNVDEIRLDLEHAGVVRV